MAVDDHTGSNGANSAVESSRAAAKEVIGKAADKAKASVDGAADQVGDVYANAADKAKRVADAVDPFVKEKPYLALGLAATLGFILGLHFAGGGTKTIYIKPTGGLRA